MAPCKTEHVRSRPGDHDQDFIADLVTEAVIDTLEIIDVIKKHTKRDRMHPPLVESALQRHFGKPAIGHTGELVDIHFFFQFFELFQ